MEIHGNFFLYSRILVWLSVCSPSQGQVDSTTLLLLLLLHLSDCSQQTEACLLPASLHHPYRNQNLLHTNVCNGRWLVNGISECYLVFFSSLLHRWRWMNQPGGRKNRPPAQGCFFPTSSSNNVRKDGNTVSVALQKLDISWHFARNGRFNLMWMWLFFSKAASPCETWLVGWTWGLLGAIGPTRAFVWAQIGESCCDDCL